MKKIIIAPDSFKETMSNVEVTNIIFDNLCKKYKDYEYKLLPIADGGEGSLNTFLMCGGSMFSTPSTSANFELCEASYILLNDSIIIEVAQNVGFKFKKSSSNPGNTTTYGVGEVLKEALKSKSKKVYFCLGGTITNDGGCGLASSLGIKFFDKENNEFIPTGDSLLEIDRIDNTMFIEKYSDLEFIGLCDVTNPLHGLNGASYIFSPQKGASQNQVITLDEGLKHLEKIVIRDLNIDCANYPGCGAAGGLGYSILAFLNGKLKNGIETILELIEFENEINDETVVITGEGKLDNQSLNGKVISGILKKVKNKKAKLIVIVGKLEGEKEDYLSKGIDEIYVTNEEGLSFEEVKIKYKEQLANCVQKIKI